MLRTANRRCVFSLSDDPFHNHQVIFATFWTHKKGSPDERTALIRSDIEFELKNYLEAFAGFLAFSAFSALSAFSASAAFSSTGVVSAGRFQMSSLY